MSILHLSEIPTPPQKTPKKQKIKLTNRKPHKYSWICFLTEFGIGHFSIPLKEDPWIW